MRTALRYKNVHVHSSKMCVCMKLDYVEATENEN